MESLQWRGDGDEVDGAITGEGALREPGGTEVDLRDLESPLGDGCLRGQARELPLADLDGPGPHEVEVPGEVDGLLAGGGAKGQE
jgi:hypothetical protein